MLLQRADHGGYEQDRAFQDRCTEARAASSKSALEMHHVHLIFFGTVS